MTNVIGLELKEAEAVLEKEGIRFEILETRSKKGIEQGKPYVVRQSLTGSVCVLTWSSFREDNCR